MHYSRMRTVSCSGRLMEAVSAWRRLSAQSHSDSAVCHVKKILHFSIIYNFSKNKFYPLTIFALRTIHPSQPCVDHPSLPQQIFCLWTTGTSALVIYCFSVSNHCLVVVLFLWFFPVPSLFYSAKECRCKCLEKWMLYQWRIQDSPKGEPTPEGEAQIYYYHPQRSCGKVMFLHVSLILFTGGVSVREPP